MLYWQKFILLYFIEFTQLIQGVSHPILREGIHRYVFGSLRINLYRGLGKLNPYIQPNAFSVSPTLMRNIIQIKELLNTLNNQNFN